jgi:hypothetical protein
MRERTTCSLSTMNQWGVFNHPHRFAECGEKENITRNSHNEKKKPSQDSRRNLCLNFKLSMAPPSELLYCIVLYCVGPAGFFLARVSRLPPPFARHCRRITHTGIWSIPVKLPNIPVTIGGHIRSRRCIAPLARWIQPAKPGIPNRDGTVRELSPAGGPLTFDRFTVKEDDYCDGEQAVPSQLAHRD